MNHSISQIPLTFNFIVASITRAPDDVSACSGTDVTLNWRYDGEDVFYRAEWFRNGEQIMTRTGSGPAELAAGVINIQHVSNGEIKIKAVSLADAGEYMLTVFYYIRSGLPTARHSVIVSVLGKLRYVRAAVSENVRSGMITQQKFKSACALEQSDQNLHWAHFK